MATTIKIYKNGEEYTVETTNLLVKDHYVAYCLQQETEKEKYGAKITAEVLFENETRNYFLNNKNELIVESDVHIFKNQNWTKRYYSCTNIVLCMGRQAPEGKWVKISEEEADEYNTTHLHTINNIKYYGFM